MQSVIVLVSAAAAGLLLQLMLELLAQPLLRRWRGRFVSVVVRRTAGPARLVLPLIASRAALPFAALHGQARTIAAHALVVPLAYALSWLAIRCTYLVDDRISGRFSLDGEDNLRARRVRTQLQVLRRVVAVALILLATGVVLLSFGRVRAVGASLLASAGVIGIVAGVADSPRSRTCSPASRSPSANPSASMTSWSSTANGVASRRSPSRTWCSGCGTSAR